METLLYDLFYGRETFISTLKNVLEVEIKSDCTVSIVYL